MKKYVSKKEIAVRCAAFDKEFAAMMERMDKAEAAYRRKHRLRKPTIKQLYDTAMRGVNIRSYKDWDKMAWFYPAETYRAKAMKARRRGSDSPPRADDKIRKTRQATKPGRKGKGNER